MGPVFSILLRSPGCYELFIWNQGCFFGLSSLVTFENVELALPLGCVNSINWADKNKPRHLRMSSAQADVECFGCSWHLGHCGGPLIPCCPLAPTSAMVCSEAQLSVTPPLSLLASCASFYPVCSKNSNCLSSLLLLPNFFWNGQMKLKKNGWLRVTIRSLLNTWRNYFWVISVWGVCSVNKLDRLASKGLRFLVPVRLCWLARCQSGTASQKQMNLVVHCTKNFRIVLGWQWRVLVYFGWFDAV